MSGKGKRPGIAFVDMEFHLQLNMPMLQEDWMCDRINRLLGLSLKCKVFRGEWK